ncbi:MAG: hypothetical protein KF899_02565 [Parvibaculum sp.]|nr:hypothetical protein [Parvibaculum sp.]
MSQTIDKMVNADEVPLRVGRPTDSDVVRIRALGAEKIGADIASLETFRRIHRRNADSLWGVYAGEDTLAGFFAFLMLNRPGTEKLVSAELDTRNPAMDALCRTGEAPHAVYIWAIVAEKRVAGALPQILTQFDAAVYARTDLYGRPATESGRRLMQKFGFNSVSGAPEIELGDLCVIRRSVEPVLLRYPGRREAAHVHV